MKTLIALALLAAPLACATNFAYVQQASQVTGTSGARTATFGSANTAGNIIVLVAFSASGATPSDTAGNTYARVFNSGGTGTNYAWVALNIKASASNTVAFASASTLVVFEYSSATTPYYTCPGAQFGAFVTTFQGDTFRTTQEAMAIMIGYWFGGGQPSFTTTGTVRFNVTEPGGQGDVVAENDVSSVLSLYSDAYGPNPANPNLTFFLALSYTATPSACAVFAPLTPGYPTTFSILY